MLFSMLFYIFRGQAAYVLLETGREIGRRAETDHAANL